MYAQHSIESRFLMGNEAIARGVIEAGCTVAAAYPGTPSSEVLESLVRWKEELGHPIYLEWSINEKVAFEIAYGASLAGARAVAIMKMVGLNVAADPFLSAAYLGVRGGLVVVCADDPGPHSSQTEQDSRFFAWFAKVPVFDPATPAQAREMALEAFELSEKYEVPVLLRPCLRVCHARQNVMLGKPREPADVGPFKKDWTRWAAIPRFRLVLHGKLNEKLRCIRETESGATPRLVIPEYDHASSSVEPSPACEDTANQPKPWAVITSGSVASHVIDVVREEPRFKSIQVYQVHIPFPAQSAALQEIVDSHERTLVVEETYPVLELQVKNRTKLLGRLSGDVPSEGELVPEVVEELLDKLIGREPLRREPPSIKARRPSLCPGCPHRPAFYAIRKVFDKAVYSGDIGCYTLGINMGAVDTCLCMGASLGMAGGLARGGLAEAAPHVVATIGDSTFYHAGVPALINAVHTRSPFVVVIMDNSVTAMTGGQPTPGDVHLADGSPAVPVDMERLIRGCGVEFLEVVDPYDGAATQEALRRAKCYTFDERRGVSVVITRRPCVRKPNVVLPSQRFQVGDTCDRCMTCMRDLECPAFLYRKQEKRVEISTDLCAGCGFCVQICPSQAIHAKEG